MFVNYHLQKFHEYEKGRLLYNQTQTNRKFDQLLDFSQSNALVSFQVNLILHSLQLVDYIQLPLLV